MGCEMGLDVGLGGFGNASRLATDCDQKGRGGRVRKTELTIAREVSQVQPGGGDLGHIRRWFASFGKLVKVATKTR